ncbi:MAG: ABC transporter permease subunit [Rhizobiales bacterium]|nr:ABC transporter permease subunit [Hyphomicrobiales bacterium]
MDLAFMLDVLVRLLPPLGLTIALSLTALVMATPLGLALGTLRTTLPDRHIAAWLLDAYVFFVRGTPILIQIFAVYFLLPAAGIKLPLFWMGVLALVVNSAGYQIEIGRAAVSSVPRGQWEAAYALGFEARPTLWSFILPQAARRMVGPVMNELSQLIKASSVLSIITLYELHKAAEAIISANFRFVEVLIVEGFWYFCFVYALSLVARALEGRLSASGGLAEQR